MNSQFPHSEIEYYGNSITGRRENNQDKFLCVQLNKHTYCFAVADGMGGSNNGEIASRIVVEDIELFLCKKFREDRVVDNLKAILHDCLLYVQDRFIEYTSANTAHAGMGTTVVLLLVHYNKCVWGNIGDSRLYGILNEQIEQLTIDHTLIQKMLQEGKKVDGDMLAKYSHLLTKCINGGVQEPDIFPDADEFLLIQKPTGFILCSDGLVLDKSETEGNQIFRDIFVKGKKLVDITRNLIDYAYSNGSGDNITAVVVRFGSKSKKKRKIPISRILPVAIVLLLGGIAYFLSTHSFVLPGKTVVPGAISFPEKTTLPKVKKDALWKPLDITDKIVKSPTSNIVWDHFTHPDQVKYYIISFYYPEKKQHYRKKVSSKMHNISLEEMQLDKYPGRYFVRVDAKLDNGILSLGNTVRIQTRAE